MITFRHVKLVIMFSSLMLKVWVLSDSSAPVGSQSRKQFPGQNRQMRSLFFYSMKLQI